MNEESGSNSTNLQCINSSLLDMNKALIGIRASLSFITCLFLTSTIAFMILFKKYIFFTQRLILYLAISSLCYEFLSMIDVTSLAAYNYTDVNSLNYCIFIAFIQQVVNWSVFLAYTCIVIDIFLKAVFKLQTDKLEIIYVICIMVVPLTFNWIPFINLTFGPAGSICWIRAINLDDCSEFQFGFWLRLALYYIPLYALLAMFIILMTVALIFIRCTRKSLTQSKTAEEKRVLKMMETEIRPIICYPFILIFINFFPLIQRFYELHSSTDGVYFVLSLLAVIVYRFQGIGITLAFLLDPETRKKLNRKEITAAFSQKDNAKVKEYPLKAGRSDSFARSVATTENYTTDYINYTNSV